MNHVITTLALSAGLLTPILGSAAVLFEDNFNEYANGLDLITAPDTEWNAYASENPNYGTGTLPDAFSVIEDSGNLFGSGTSNKFMKMAVTQTVEKYNINSSANAFTSSTLTGQVDFRFVDPTDAASTGYGWAVRIGYGNGNDKTSFAIILDEGKLHTGVGASIGNGDVLSTYSMDTAYAVTIVFNNSADSMIYAGGSVASKTMDVYLDGVLIGNDVPGSGGEGFSSDPIDDPVTYTNIANINFTAKAYSPFQDTLYIDDVEVNSDISIPEPSTSAFLIGISVLLVTFLRRRLKGARS
ncbi:hypothetical protein [Ruficoccus sp. ZRK36]|uniref:hypothetical protein n=1 Tax=Ruficoccus sp. ZRK36 TaxID=2866311 RepID=UPI001C73CE0D|nr:hypothetical protein [Ruficoccus sp. ZRK36]QYY35061.1 hypothetical protein K0V07_12210 [Ruficoccus sp. ZRK36]